MFELERFAVAIIGSTLAALWDLKTTDIPDIVVAAMVAFALIFGIGEGVITGDYSALSLSIGTGLIFLVIGLIMYFSGQWGGGDGGLLVGVGMLMSYLNQNYISFPIAYLANVIIVGVIYSILYAFYLISRNRPLLSALKKEFEKMLRSSKMLLMVVVLGALSLLFSSFYPKIASIPIILVVLLVFYRLAKIIDASFYRKILSKNLKVGDMIGEDIPKLKLYKKLIRGLTEKEVKQIRKMKKTVLIREGIRFGPVFPLALILTVLYGNLLFILFF